MCGLIDKVAGSDGPWKVEIPCHSLLVDYTANMRGVDEEANLTYNA